MHHDMSLAVEEAPHSHIHSYLHQNSKTCKMLSNGCVLAAILSPPVGKPLFS